MTQYSKLDDDVGQLIDPKEHTLRFACCDCGLVHDLFIEVQEDGKVALFFRRNNRSTGQLRVRGYGNLQQKIIRGYYMKKEQR